MNISREEKKAEAIQRMKALGIVPGVIKEFERYDIVEVTEPPLGGLYYLNEDQKKMVADIENEHNCLVYLVVRSYTSIGMMDSFLIVSDYEEEWEYDREDIENDIVFTYTHNYDEPMWSEFGSIGIKKIGGGLIRIS